MSRQCDANDINGCEKAATLVVIDSRGRTVKEMFCCEACANEWAGEVSEGTWSPFPNAPHALTEAQIIENMTYFRE